MRLCSKSQLSSQIPFMSSFAVTVQFDYSVSGCGSLKCFFVWNMMVLRPASDIYLVISIVYRVALLYRYLFRCLQHTIGEDKISLYAYFEYNSFGSEMLASSIIFDIMPS